MKKIFFLITISFILNFGFVMEESKAQIIELKMAHFMSPIHIQHQKSFVPFAENVDKLTGGRVKIKIFPGGALGAPTQLPDAVKTGITDIAFIIPSYTTARFPRISVLDLPFICDDAVHATKIIYDLKDKYFLEDFKDYKVLWFYSCGTGQLMSATRPIHSLDDLKGMKMRAPSAYMSKALRLLGSNPVAMPISELTVSLQKKVVDGILTPWSAIEDFKLWDLIKYLTEIDMYLSPMAVVMNKDKYNSLPDFAKKSIDEATGMQWGLHAARVYEEHDNNTMKKNKDLKKIDVFKLPDSEKEKFIKKVKIMETEWVDELSKSGISATKILEDVYASAKKFR